MKQLLIVLVTVLLLPVAANALTLSYWYLGANGNPPYTGWDGAVHRYQTGVMHVDTTIFGMPHGRSYAHYNWSGNNYGQDTDTGVNVSFAFGLRADAFNVSFDEAGGIGTWSAATVWEGPSWFADFYDASQNGELWTQLDGPYYSYTLYEAGPGEWFSSYGAFQQAVRSRDVVPSPTPSLVPLPPAAWVLVGGLLSLGALRLRRRA